MGDDPKLDDLGIRLPPDFGDRLQPEKLKDANIAEIFRDVGGVKFDGLFRGVKFPDVTDTRKTEPTSFFDRSAKLLGIIALRDLLKRVQGLIQ